LNTVRRRVHLNLCRRPLSPQPSGYVSRVSNSRPSRISQTKQERCTYVSRVRKIAFKVVIQRGYPEYMSYSVLLALPRQKQHHERGRQASGMSVCTTFISTAVMLKVLCTNMYEAKYDTWSISRAFVTCSVAYPEGGQ
jgi:hypothetical protein